MAREYFKCFHSYKEKCKKLTDQELGRLFRALMTFSETGTAPDLTGRESIAFDFIADEIARDEAKYAETCRKNAENGAKGGKRTVANGTDREREEAKSSEINKVEGIRYKEDIKEISSNEDKKKSTAFHAPTVEEVRQYCEDRNNGIDPEYFVNYYENRGWYLSKGIKMRDWKRAVITWEKNGIINGYTGKRVAKQNAALKYEQTPISKSDFDSMVVNLDEV